MRVRLAISGDVRTVILRAAAEVPGVAGRDIQVVELGHGQATTTIVPIAAAVVGTIQPAVVAVIDAPRSLSRHDHTMMVSMRVLGIPALKIPTRNLLPGRSTVRGPV